MMHSIKRKRDLAKTSPKQECKATSGVIKTEPETKECDRRPKRVKKEPKYEFSTDEEDEPECQATSGVIKTEPGTKECDDRPKRIKKEPICELSSDEEYEPERKATSGVIRRIKKEPKNEICTDEEYVPDEKSKNTPKPPKRKKAAEKSKNMQSSQKRKKSTEKPKSKKKVKLELEANDSLDGQTEWDVRQELAVHLDLDLNISINIVELIEEENTIPFIARYRKEKTGNMDASKLRNFVECYEALKSVQAKAHTMIQAVTKAEKMTPTLLRSFHTARSMEELEHLYAPFKTNKKSLAERAKLLGLDVPAVAFLENPAGPPIDLNKYVQPETKGLATLQEVETGIQHIIADIIAKDYAVLKFVQETFLPSHVQVCCKINRNFEKKLKSEENVEKEAHKFEQYYDFRRGVCALQPHQVMAINRGENLKILTVKLDIPEYLKKQFFNFTYFYFCKSRTPSSEINRKLIDSCIKDACERFIEPIVCRKVRSDLTKKAEKASLEIFITNLRNLLLGSPIQGKVITAIDPGFTNGCKIAVVAPNGDVLHTETLYLHHNSRGYSESMKLADVILKFRCTVIGIGNGTACRQTESVVTRLIDKKIFYPSLDVVYCIVNESGVSVYSVSDEAAAEFPDMDPNQRSAVSLARRLLDPLSEHVKVEPKHLGVGMYQHDISEVLLKKTLDSVVEECVSFTGVDVNVCSKTVLSKVAGLTARRAEAIIKWRKEKGAFMNREQIRSVTGIGAKTFEQCAGFLKILSKTLEHCQADDKSTEVKAESSSKSAKSKKKSATVNCRRNLLDATCIHPESYEIAMKVITAAECSLTDLGSPDFIRTMKKFLSESKLAQLASEFDVGVPTMKLIADGLQRELDYDIRSEFSQPLFKQGIRDISSLEIGLHLSGKVMNVTSFGVFVDVGVGTDGLIHTSQLRPHILKGRPLVVGDCVEVKILSIEEKRKRIGLALSGVTERSKVELQ